MRKNILYASLFFAAVSFFNFSCQKETRPPLVQEEMETDETIAARNGNHYGHLTLTKTFSADVVIQWLNMQLDMLRVPLAAGTGSQEAGRAQAYCGIALYEAVVPGMPHYRSLQGQLTDFQGLPAIEKGKAYHWAATANAALAEMNRKLFPTTSAANKTAIDNLESSLHSTFSGEADAATLQRSVAFGREIAVRVAAWAALDGSANVNPPYVPAAEFIGPAFWVQSLGAGNTLVTTPPNFPQAALPYASQRRLLVPGVKYGTRLAPPPPYSTDPSSPFFAMVKDVYDKSQNLTPEQTAMAIYHRDAPGYPGGGHFIAVLSQVFTQAKAKLDDAAIAYVKTGIASHDVSQICFIEKYKVNLVRPINYIRDVMGHPTWTALFNTPGHPEFPSAHAVNGTVNARMLTDVFGKNFHFTLNTYEYLGLPARSYDSFYEMGKEMADSRVFAGIHYQASCDKGRWLGEKVSSNILRRIKFLKEDKRHYHHNNRHDHR